MADFDYSRIPPLPSEVFVAPLRKPAGLGEDWLEPAQRDYSAAEHRIWDDLFARQMALLPGRACRGFLQGFERLDLGRGGIPELGALNEKLRALTGWTVVPVPMLIPDQVFFYHLANRRFPAGNFIRTREQFDYIQEPDVFHDVFGHVPLLADPVFAEYLAAYGRAGWKALRYNRLKALSALYWYTVEFGLIQTDEGLRIYGAGIVSSKTESIFALEDPSPNRIGFELQRLMKTDYRIDDFQQTYFVIDSYEQLFDATVKTDFAPIYDKMQGNFELKPEDIEASDTVLHRGSQAYAEAGGRLAPVGSGK